MIVARTPIRDWFEAALAQSLVAMFFPVSPRVWVTIQRADQGTDGVNDVVPGSVLWPLVSRNPYPCHDEAAEQALSVCRFSIRLLSSVSREEREKKSQDLLASMVAGALPIS